MNYWIRVDERLPTEGDPIVMLSGGDLYLGRFARDRFWEGLNCCHVTKYCQCSPIVGVTEWMALEKTAALQLPKPL